MQQNCAYEVSNQLATVLLWVLIFFIDSLLLSASLPSAIYLLKTSGKRMSTTTVRVAYHRPGSKSTNLVSVTPDVSFWYGNGPGNPAVAAQGIGYVQELISRLSGERITSFETSVNGTIVSSNVTFPLNQPIFVDASHDTIMSASKSSLVYTSLLFNANCILQLLSL